VAHQGENQEDFYREEVQFQSGSNFNHVLPSRPYANPFDIDTKKFLYEG
jgi:hypothetical protein